MRDVFLEGFAAVGSAVCERILDFQTIIRIGFSFD